MATKSCELVLCFFVFFVISFSAISVSAQTCDNTTGTFIPNSPYDKNRRLILSTLASNVTAQEGYFIGSIGIAPDQVFATGMCAPGSERDVCSLCIRSTSESLLQSCLDQADAFFWSGEETLCLVRYANRPFSGLLVMDPLGAIFNTGELNTNQTVFDIEWNNLTSSMIAGITSSSSGGNNSSKYYSDDIALVPDFKNISALMQCTPDVSSEDCNTCLRQNVVDYDNCCRGHQGGVMSRPNCFFRWEVYPFSGAIDQINLPKSPPPSVTSPSPIANITKNGKSLLEHFQKIVLFCFYSRISGGKIAAIVVVTVKKAKARNGSSKPYTLKWYFFTSLFMVSNEAESVQFDLKTIESATSNFSERNKLGKGGFGEVYKGMLMNGTEIAVKRLSKTSGQGEVEFKNEVVVVAKLQHINLVRLLGFSLQGEEKLLVYEFVSNKSLDYFLFDPTKRNQLDWTMRRNIIGGITRGILYLHQDSRLKIIHRDLKASNILLDADMNPKIADFGMARIFGVDQTVANTGRVVWKLWENKSLHELLDPFINQDFTSEEVIRYIHIGLLCVQENPADRPTMSTIHQMLTNSSITLPVPLPPGFFFRNGPGSNPGQSNSKSFACSVDEATITDVNPR
ncbi:putative protein [Arabidopsis thaliana]|nr:putative protein [Arabidopsis thaliana]CAB79281.1 putative protein [Arabidopsis thaliana]